jgi:hypothetical protein
LFAASAQIESHCVLQQNGSLAHTVLQHAASAQPAVDCAAQQLPDDGAPQTPCAPATSPNRTTAPEAMQAKL